MARRDAARRNSGAWQRRRSKAGMKQRHQAKNGVACGVIETIISGGVKHSWHLGVKESGETQRKSAGVA